RAGAAARRGAGPGREPARGAPRRFGWRGGDGRGVAAVLRLGERLGAERAGDRLDRRLAGDHPYAIEAGAAERSQHVAQHRARQLIAVGEREGAREPLLGDVEVLHGNGRDDHRRSRARAASAASWARLVMTMSATSAATPSPASSGAQASSRRSTSRRRSHGAYARAMPSGETGSARGRLSAPAGPPPPAPPAGGRTRAPRAPGAAP